jgi:transposase-like protein
VGKPGLKKVHRYSVEFKVTAVKLSGMPGVQVQTVADALDHPSLHALAVAEGGARRPIAGTSPGGSTSAARGEIQRLQAREREHAMRRRSMNS